MINDQWIMRSNLTTTLTHAESAQLRIDANQPHQTQNIEDGDIPFSEVLLLLEELGADAGLAIETAQMKLFDLEALLSFNILHDSDNDNDNVTETGKLPRHQELYQKGPFMALVKPHSSCLTRYIMSLISVLKTCSQSSSYLLTLLC